MAELGKNWMGSNRPGSTWMDQGGLTLLHPTSCKDNHIKIMIKAKRAGNAKIVLKIQAGQILHRPKPPLSKSCIGHNLPKNIKPVLYSSVMLPS